MQMIALQKVYVFSQRKEYPEGVTFDITDEREAGSLVAMKKAMVVPDKPKHVDLPKQEDGTIVGDGVTASFKIYKSYAGEVDTPKKFGGRGRYQRRDMTATDGPTGVVSPSPSSLPEPQPEEPTSDNSETEQES